MRDALECAAGGPEEKDSTRGAAAPGHHDPGRMAPEEASPAQSSAQPPLLLRAPLLRGKPRIVEVDLVGAGGGGGGGAGGGVSSLAFNAEVLLLMKTTCGADGGEGGGEGGYGGGRGGVRQLDMGVSMQEKDPSAEMAIVLAAEGAGIGGVERP